MSYLQVPSSNLRIPRMQRGRVTNTMANLYSRLGFRHALLKMKTGGFCTIAWPVGDNAPTGEELLRLRDSDVENDTYGMPVANFLMPQFEDLQYVEPFYDALDIDHVVVQLHDHQYICRPDALNELATLVERKKDVPGRKWVVRDAPKKMESIPRFLKFPITVNDDWCDDLFNLAELCGHKYFQIGNCWNIGELGKADTTKPDTEIKVTANEKGDVRTLEIKPTRVYSFASTDVSIASLKEGSHTAAFSPTNRVSSQALERKASAPAAIVEHIKTVSPEYYCQACGGNHA